MRYRDAFIERCRTRGLDESGIERALGTVSALAERLAEAGSDIDRAEIPEVEAFIDRTVVSAGNGADIVLPLARYFQVSGQNDVTIRLLAYLLPIGVLPAMAERLSALKGAELCGRVMSGVAVPPEGSPPEAYPTAAKAFVERLTAEVGLEEAHRVLAWNVHGIPAQSFAGERERLEKLGSIDAWLEDFHSREVEVLAGHAADGTLWFEQRITPEVVEFARNNQEILGGMRAGTEIFLTKIPYDPARYLASTDPLERRRLACHCPLAVAGIGPESSRVPARWCSCSAGFTKFRFDVVFGVDTEVRILNTVLDGAETCRFAVRIPKEFESYIG